MTTQSERWEWVKGSELRPGDVVRAVDVNALGVGRTRALLRKGPVTVGEQDHLRGIRYIVGHMGLGFPSDVSYERRVADPMQGKRWRFETTVSGYLMFRMRREEFNATLELWPDARRGLGFQVGVVGNGCWYAEYAPGIPAETQHARTRQLEAWLADRVEAEKSERTLKCLTCSREFSAAASYTIDGKSPYCRVCYESRYPAQAEPKVDKHCVECNCEFSQNSKRYIRNHRGPLCHACATTIDLNNHSDVPIPAEASGEPEPDQVVISARSDKQREQAYLARLKRDYLDHIDATWNNPPPRSGWLDSQLIAMIQRDWPERYQEVYRKSDESESKPRRAKGPPVVRERVTGTCGLRMGR